MSVSNERDPSSPDAFAAGCLGGIAGFVLSALVLIPLWWIYPFSTGDSSAFGPTLVGLSLGVGYALVFAIITVRGLSRTLRTGLGVVVPGILLGILVGIGFRDAMLDGCLLGTGPQPDWCNEPDPSFLRPVIPAYWLAGTVLGVALWGAGALRLGRRGAGR